MEHLADTIGENRFARQKKGKEKRKERGRIVENDRYSFDDIEGSLQFFFFFCFFLDRFRSLFFFFFFVFQLSNRLKIRGDGFSPDFLAKMFSKFFSTRNVEGDETLTMKPRSSKANVERFE